MPPIFPGMDPYLEGSDWQDVHNSLAYVIKRQLVPQLPPAYFAHLEKYVVEDFGAEDALGIFYPDVNVMEKRPNELREPEAPTYRAKRKTTPPTLTIDLSTPIKRNVPVVQVKDKENNQLITTIEIISPANKRPPGFEKYEEKQRELRRQGIHLIEVDFLRKGKRRIRHPLAVSAHYLVSLARAGKAKVDLWALDVKDALPTVPVPLRSPDPDVLLDLQKAFREMYAEGGYARSTDYQAPPPLPAFSEDDQKWMGGILEDR